MTARLDFTVAEILRLSGPVPDPEAYAHYLAGLNPKAAADRLETLRQQQKEIHEPRPQNAARA